MQIFVTSVDPVLCAEALDNVRVSKMAVEAAQIMSTALYLSGRWEVGMCKPTHRHHPLVLWAQQQANYNWLHRHYIALCEEYTKRTGKVPLILDRDRYLAKWVRQAESYIQFYNAAENKSLGISFKHERDVDKAYRAYLSARWDSAKNPPRWTNREQPQWYASKRNPISG